MPGNIQGDEEYEELRGGGDRRLVFSDRTGEHGCVELGVIGVNPFILVVDVILVTVVVLEDVNEGGNMSSSSRGREICERRCVAVAAEMARTGGDAEIGHIVF